MLKMRTFDTRSMFRVTLDMRWMCGIALIVAAINCCRTNAASAAAPLHQQIDQMIAAKAGGPGAPSASDAEFLRRISLDLIGTIPSADKRVNSSTMPPDKRTQLIDTLLASPKTAITWPRRST